MIPLTTESMKFAPFCESAFCSLLALTRWPIRLGLFRAAAGAQAAPAAPLADMNEAEDDDVAERLERLGKANAGLFR